MLTLDIHPSRKRSWSKTLFKPEEFDNVGFCFRVDGKHFENGAFQKRWRHDNPVFPDRVSRPKKKKSKMTGDCYVWLSVDGATYNHLLDLEIAKLLNVSCSYTYGKSSLINKKTFFVAGCHLCINFCAVFCFYLSGLWGGLISEKL